MKSYLKNRTQFVQVNGYVLSKRAICIRCAARTALGQLHFLLYINDKKRALKFNVRLFADDTLLYLSSKVAHTLESKINNKIGKNRKNTNKLVFLIL